MLPFELFNGNSSSNKTLSAYTEDVLKYVAFLREASHLGKMKRTEKNYTITTILQNFQGFFFLSKWLYKRLFMKKEILNKLICFLIIYLPIGWMTHLGKSIIHYFWWNSQYFLINPFLFHQLLELLQAFLFNIWFNWKVPLENRVFISALIPEKFLDTEQEVECASQIFTCYH